MLSAIITKTEIPKYGKQDLFFPEGLTVQFGGNDGLDGMHGIQLCRFNDVNAQFGRLPDDAQQRTLWDAEDGGVRGGAAVLTGPTKALRFLLPSFAREVSQTSRQK